MLTFTTPWALVLLALLPAIALAGHRRLRRLPNWGARTRAGTRPRPRASVHAVLSRLSVSRAHVALALRLLVTGLLVVALAGPQWRTSDRRVAVVFVVDASASVGASGEQAGMAWAARATRAAGPADQAAMILFGAAPRLAVPLAHYTRLPDPSTPAGSATDIAAALRLALALLPAGGASPLPGRVVLLSDGQDTSSDAAGAGAATGVPVASVSALALSRGIPIDTVAMTPPRRHDVLVRALDVPPTVRVGEHIPLHITLHSTYATNALLSVSIDGVAAQREIALPAGDTVLGAEPAIPARAGPHTVSVRIDAPGDAVPQNNRLDAAILAGPPGRLLFVVNDPTQEDTQIRALAATLSRAHMSVVPTVADKLPQQSSAYATFDEVLLDDVPATSLSLEQQRALRDAVYNQGLGLLTVGGPDAFGDGNYAHTPLEQTLPVFSISVPRRSSPPLALMLVIDKSGSMGDTVDGVAKIDMVKLAASSALDRLSSGDGVGVLAFDDSNHWIVPFHALQGAADKVRIRQQIAGLDADGNTTIYPALRAAEAAVLRMPTAYHHVVLLTDGQGEQDAPFDRLIRRMHSEHIVLSTIGVGDDVEQNELRHWAALGGGLFHYVSDPHDIPRIIINETRYGTTGSAEVQGHIRLGVASASPLLRALSGQALPPITTYDATEAKTTAQVSVQSASGDPLLSSWQYGLGRVVTWASDAGSAWATRWSATRLPAFWTDLAQWTMRGYTPAADAPALTVDNGALRVSLSLQGNGTPFDDTASPRVRITAPDGTTQVAGLALSGPGLYTARVPLSGPGVYTAERVDDDRTATRPDAAGAATTTATSVTALAVPYPAEYADDGVDTAFLAHLAAATGGQVLSRPADAFAHAGLPATVVWLPLWPLLLALALLLFPLDVAIRLLLPPDPAYRRA